MLTTRMGVGLRPNKCNYPQCADAGEAGREGLEVVAEGFSGVTFKACVDVEPAGGEALVGEVGDVGEIAAKGGVAETKGFAGLALVPSLELPASGEKADQSIAALLKREFQNAGEGKALGEIEAGNDRLTNLCQCAKEW